MSGALACSQDNTKPPLEVDERVSVCLSCVGSERTLGTVRRIWWNGEDSDTGWWASVELDTDPGPARSLTDMPRLPGKFVTVRACGCRKEPGR